MILSPPTAHAQPAKPAPSDSLSLVNLAARQRMLSQRMILQAVMAASSSEDHWLQAAQKTLQLFCDSQARLQATVATLDGAAARLLQQTYDGPQGVGRTISQFMLNMRAALEDIPARLDRKPPRSLRTLVDSTDTVLEALNTATTAFDTLTKGKTDLLMKELTSIVSDIQTVAREAKVVSFNAQVIAARAGQHGREFGVVAEVLTGVTAEIDSLSRKAIDLAARNKT